MSKIKTYKFSDLYKMSSGISTKPVQAGHGSPFLSFSAVFKDYFLPNVLEDLMDTSEKEKEVYSIIKGDVFLTRTSETLDELGMSSVAVKDYADASYSGFLKRLRPTQDDISYDKYMAFYLRSKLFRKTMTNNAIMTLRASLNEQIFSYLELLLPPYIEQRKIGDFLYLLNEKIELNNRINAQLEAMAKLIYDYWFVQFDFPNEDGKPYKSSGGKMVYDKELKREIPEGWEIKELNDIAQNIMGQSPKGKSYNKEGIGMPLLNGPADYDNGALFARTFTTQPTRQCKKDDMVLCIRATIGNLVYSEQEFCLGRGVAAVRPNEKRFSELIYYQLLQEIERFKIQATGSIIKGITKNDLTESKCLIPSAHLIDMFHSNINPIFNKIRTNKKENVKLKELRDWLLPMLMNGQVTVGTTYEKVEEKLAVAAEPGLAYENDKTAIDALFETIYRDYEVAVIQLLTDRRFGFTYGKKYTHKMFSNIEMLNTMPKFKELAFEEKGWGMYSKVIAKTIDAQKFIYFHRLDHGAEVLKVKLTATKEITDWMARPKNKGFVSQVNHMLNLYEKPLIDKQMDRIELLNTVLECMKVLETDNPQAIRNQMANWEMYEEYNKTKAEKFDENLTFHMIQFVKNEAMSNLNNPI